ncbi:PASTA domain-containing protein, partial [Klebsiella pneumoniae]|uniref:PASTA domain-containing protein n=2 Tax=Bacteria TaxID=2 RepID=UPI00301337BB
TARTVPNLIDVASERAQDALSDLDLTAKVVLESSSEIAEGNVIRTDPKAGVAVAEGDEITLYVSSGKETVVVPTLKGLSLAAAKDALSAAGL